MRVRKIGRARLTGFARPTTPDPHLAGNCPALACTNVQRNIKNPALNGARRSSLLKKKNNWLLLRNKSLPGILRSIFLVEPV